MSQNTYFCPKIKHMGCFEIFLARGFQPISQNLFFGTLKCQKWPKIAKFSYNSAEKSQNTNFCPKIKSRGCFEIVLARGFQPWSQNLAFGTLECQKVPGTDKFSQNSGKKSQNPYFVQKSKVGVLKLSWQGNFSHDLKIWLLAL